MSEAGPHEAAATATPISSEAILEELVSLRQREGLHIRKVLQQCPNLQVLPATLDELRRRHLGESDRHVAAHEVLICALDALVPRSRFVRVLRKTLNVDGDELGLEQRRKLLLQELYVTERAYRKLEEDAYAHLAGVLVAARSSPCSDDPSDSLHFATVIVDTPDRQEKLVNILISFAITTEDGVRNDLATEMMALLPSARAALSGEVLGQGEPPWDLSNDMFSRQGLPWALARDLLDAILMNAWPPQEDSTNADSTLLSAGSLSDLLLGEARDVGANHARVAAREQERFPGKSFVMEKGRQVNNDFLTLKEDSLTRLAEQIDRIERANTWAEILPESFVHAKR